MEISKRDWKLFREKIADWQESYMDRLNKEYIKLLSKGVEILLTSSGHWRKGLREIGKDRE